MFRFLKIGLMMATIAMLRSIVISETNVISETDAHAMKANKPAIALLLDSTIDSNSPWQFRVTARNVSSVPIIVDRELCVFFSLKVHTVEGVAIRPIIRHYCSQPMHGKWETRFAPLLPDEAVSRIIDITDPFKIFVPFILFTDQGEMPSAFEATVQYQIPSDINAIYVELIYLDANVPPAAFDIWFSRPFNDVGLLLMESKSNLLRLQRRHQMDNAFLGK